MDQFNSKNYPIFANFLNKLAKDLTKFYYKKLDKPFKISNKLIQGDLAIIQVHSCVAVQICILITE